ncbi:hypothetical protein TCAL_13583 [Tigriopus californicus]|uniref:CUB domain-containing protein n=1 Tax=Tigriopus californicus TaxID=6832 RepID=A0A553PU54_TIGCA|nr:hypothetical protein TCAL_13583 [Tigriopus californicus]
MGGKSLVFVLMSASLLIGVQSMAASRLARVFVGGCGTMVRENSTYFQGDATTMAGGCSYQVCPIRLDFIMFNIAGPDVSTTTTFSTLNGNAVEMGGAASNMASNCITDSFSATDGSGMGSNVICGDNTGQHMYLSAEGGCVKLMFQFGSMAMGMGTAMAMRMWKIKGCCGYGATGTGVNGKDCVTIPGAKNAAGLFVSPKFCGRGGLVTVDMMAAASVCTTTIPFSVRFISDDFEFAGAINEATVMDKGFKLSYMQDAVMCV